MQITVFGIPPEEREAALKVLRSCGEIMHHGTFGQDYTNFLHVKFSNTLEARKALSLNGKPISMHTIIGTRPIAPEQLDKIEKYLHGREPWDLSNAPVAHRPALPSRPYYLDARGQATAAQTQPSLFSKLYTYVFGF